MQTEKSAGALPDSRGAQEISAIGGDASRALDRILNASSGGVDYIATNNDLRDLKRGRAGTRLQFGKGVMCGLGATATPRSAPSVPRSTVRRSASRASPGERWPALLIDLTAACDCLVLVAQDGAILEEPVRTMAEAFAEFDGALVEAAKSLLADVANEAEVEAAARRWVNSRAAKQ
ncbi:MAG: hypothetical protein Q8P41_29860 [Pseudomonadota bacterium]|nr:hypothetical protein [Pseudomonadota bacterium]